MRNIGRSVLLVGALAWSILAVPANAAPSDPLFVFVPHPSPASNPPTATLPPPFGFFNGPCGLGVDGSGNFYVSEYYHHSIDVYQPNAEYTTKGSSGNTGYLGQLPEVDHQDGPCGLAFDGSDRLFVNDYHRSVLRYGAFPAFGAGTAIAGAGVDSKHPTGIAVDSATGTAYVNDRRFVAVYDSTGAAVEAEGKPLHIGEQGSESETSLTDGYGLAFSEYPATAGRLYVADAASNTVKIYDPAVDKVNPVSEITGAGSPEGHFVSLRDSALAVDRSSGNVYVIDNLQPWYTYIPKAVVDVFGPTGTYKGHFKYAISDALPPGLAVDNSTQPSQGRVYVTSGNVNLAGVYAYGPAAATSSPPVGPIVRLTMRSSGGGAIASTTASESCSSFCEPEVRSGTTVSLEAVPDSGAAFSGWSGACSGQRPICDVQMDQAAAVEASFVAGEDGEAPRIQSQIQPSDPGVDTAGETIATASPPHTRRHRLRRKVHRRRHGAPHMGLHGKKHH